MTEAHERIFRQNALILWLNDVFNSKDLICLYGLRASLLFYRFVWLISVCLSSFSSCFHYLDYLFCWNFDGNIANMQWYTIFDVVLFQKDHCDNERNQKTARIGKRESVQKTYKRC